MTYHDVAIRRFHELQLTDPLHPSYPDKLAAFDAANDRSLAQLYRERKVRSYRR